MAPEQRPLVRIGDIVIDVYGGRTQPDIDVRGGSRTVEHDPIGRTPVIQDLGPEAKHVTIVGECSMESANQVDDLSQGDAVAVRSDRFTGDAVVTNHNTTPLKKRHEGIRIYQFRVELDAVSE